jgi:hypothetical protein
MNQQVATDAWMVSNAKGQAALDFRSASDGVRGLAARTTSPGRLRGSGRSGAGMGLCPERWSQCRSRAKGSMVRGVIAPSGEEGRSVR